MSDSEIVEAARRYPTVEEIATLLKAHRWKKRDRWPRNGPEEDFCVCGWKGLAATAIPSDNIARHAASVIVAMWEELAKEHAGEQLVKAVE